MRYHIGLGIGHVHTQRQASSDLDQETAGYITRSDDMEEVCVLEIPDDDDDYLSGGEPRSEHSSDFGDDKEDDDDDEEMRDEEFLVDEEDLYYGY